MINLPETFNLHARESNMQLDSANQRFNFAFPADYYQFMSQYDGGEGFIGEHYLVLWKNSQLKQFNDEYEFSIYAPGLVAFGSNGGGEALAFDTRVEPYSVVIVPFIGMCDDDAIPLASSFSDFLNRLKNDNRSYFGN
jgi:SMI1 / KNR4 family (SUKH-1)